MSYKITYRVFRSWTGGMDSVGATLLFCACAVFLLGVSGCDETSDQHTPTDQWAGKSVLTGADVDGMVSARLHNAPKLDEIAPPLSLRDASSGKIRQLSKLHDDKPVVLFFGSRSCNITQDSVESVKHLWERFGDRVDFYLVYIREAHPEGGFGSSDPLAAKFAIRDSDSAEERAAAAREFGSEKEIGFPILVDEMNDSAAVRWAAWPVRLFLIDEAGKVIFAGQQGPWHHKPTRGYDAGLPRVPEKFKNLPNYSSGSLEEVLEKTLGGRLSPRP